MAPRSSNFNNDVNQDLVFDNLGLSQEDLGMGGNDGVFNDPGDDDDGDLDQPRGKSLTFDEDSDGDDGDDVNDPFALRDDEVPQDRRVSHTDDGRQRQQQQRREPRPLPKEAKVRPDKNGNLLNEKGEIVARAGREARYYTSREKAKKDLATHQGQLRDTAGRLSRVTQIARELKGQVDAFGNQFKAIKDMGFTADDQVAAMNLFSQMRKDPKGTLTKLLTRAAANGITIDGQSGQPQQAQIADVVKGLLDEQLKPFKENLTANQTRERQEQQRRDDAAAVDAEVGQFFGRNPEAVPYAPVFARVLRDPAFSGMSLGEIYARILQNQSRGGNRPQLRDRGRTNGRTPSRRGSPPNGRSAPFNGGTEIANVNTSYDEIINGILDEQRV
jgi:hypothetical protein